MLHPDIIYLDDVSKWPTIVVCLRMLDQSTVQHARLLPIVHWKWEKELCLVTLHSFYLYCSFYLLFETRSPFVVLTDRTE